ncbi:ParA family protein [Plebeiibacterium sediminum]|uniref:ParA family protein n=1 Tax=Plebeiibacterium sediminum TaxID=2992112 RepID=A0AAE3M5B4_9BACT|nr:ParA family protein [Plebeiobacterium sediminum]MCW3787221.1 ParA family protein [Plebeiobacterium sediminum]
MATIISFINQKGGVGKTTSAVSIASALSLKKYNVLVVDLDPQSNASTSLQIRDSKINTYTVFKGEPIKIEQVNDHLFVLPSSINVSSLEYELINEAGREQLLNEILDPIKQSFDYIILDCSPNLGLITINALVASDYFITVLLPHHLSIEGLSSLLEVTNKVTRRINNNLKSGGYILNQFSIRKILHKQTADVLEKHFPDKLFRSTIRENIALAEAPSTGKSIFDYAPNSNGARDYMSLTEEIIQKLK